MINIWVLHITQNNECYILPPNHKNTRYMKIPHIIPNTYNVQCCGNTKGN